MLFEQAVYSLPEILLGNHYTAANYEIGLVSAFSQSVLQELNGRNALNPISYLKSEVLYKLSGFGEKNRRLRADLQLQLHNLRQGNELLSGYGWRHSNWLEAKFFRPTKGNVKAINTSLLLADLIRVTVLTPSFDKKNYDENLPLTNNQSRCNTGRYLLHVYRGRPESHITSIRNSTKTATAGTRFWLNNLVHEGHQILDNFDLHEEGRSFMDTIGKQLANMSFTININNIVVSHYDGLNDEAYTCILTRIDSFEVSCSISNTMHTYGINANRDILETVKGKSKKLIQDYVATYIK